MGRGGRLGTGMAVRLGAGMVCVAVSVLVGTRVEGRDWVGNILGVGVIVAATVWVACAWQPVLASIKNNNPIKIQGDWGLFMENISRVSDSQTENDRPLPPCQADPQAHLRFHPGVASNPRAKGGLTVIKRIEHPIHEHIREVFVARGVVGAGIPIFK